MRGSSPRMTLSVGRLANATRAGLARFAPRQALSPVFFAAPGTPSFQPTPPLEGAERRKTRGAWRTHPGRLAKPPDTPGEARRLRGDGGAPLGAPLRRFLSPGPRFRGRKDRYSPAPIRAAFAALHPRRVQPSKAAPHSGGGRRPEASRCRGYEPQQQAPHPAPSSKRLAKTPSVEPGWG